MVIDSINNIKYLNIHRGFFIVSYFTSLAMLLVIIILCVRVFYSGPASSADASVIDTIYERFKCIKIPDNYQSSFKTFLSMDSFMMGIIGIVGNFGTVFIDQSYWQLNATASPKKSSIAFILAGFIWFFVSNHINSHFRLKKCKIKIKKFVYEIFKITNFKKTKYVFNYSEV